MRRATGKTLSGALEGLEGAVAPSDEPLGAAG
jgi:hypothetical protein